MNLVNEFEIEKVVECGYCGKRKRKITLYLQTHKNVLHILSACLECCSGEQLSVTTSFLIKNIKEGFVIENNIKLIIKEEDLFKLINDSLMIKEIK